MPSWTTSDASPCTSVGARTTLAPYATPIDCIPRHTPSSGIRRSAAIRTVSTDTPAVPGSPGPGEMTMPRRSATGSSASPLISSAVIWSLRTTRTSAPAAWSACTRLNVNES